MRTEEYEKIFYDTNILGSTDSERVLYFNEPMGPARDVNLTNMELPGYLANDFRLRELSVYCATIYIEKAVPHYALDTGLLWAGEWLLNLLIGSRRPLQVPLSLLINRPFSFGFHTHKIDAEQNFSVYLIPPKGLDMESRKVIVKCVVGLKGVYTVPVV